MSGRHSLIPLVIAACASLLLTSSTLRADVIYGSDWVDGTIQTFNPNGSTSVFVSGLTNPEGLAFDKSGNLYVAIQNALTIDKITPAGQISTYASGLGANRLQSIAGLAFDRYGNLFVSVQAGSIDMVSPNGKVSTFATSLPSPQGYGPQGLAFDAFGNLYVADQGAGEVLKLDPSGNQSVFATISTTNLPYYGPIGVAFGPDGNLYVSGGSSSIEQITPAGTNINFAPTPPGPLAFDANWNLYTASGQYGVREFDPGGNVLTTFSTTNAPLYLADPSATLPIPEPQNMVIMAIATCFGLSRRFRLHSRHSD